MTNDALRPAISDGGTTATSEDEIAHLTYVLHDLDTLYAAGRLAGLRGPDLRVRYALRQTSLLAGRSATGAPSQDDSAEPTPIVATQLGATTAEQPPAAGTSVADHADQASERAANASRQRMSSPDPATILLWLGAFLVTIAALIFVAYNWAAFSGSTKTLVLGGLTTACFAAGWLTQRRPSLQPASRTFYALGSILTPLVAVATYAFWLVNTGIRPATLAAMAALAMTALYARMAVAGLGRVYGVGAAVAAWSACVALLLRSELRFEAWAVPTILGAVVVLEVAVRLRGRFLALREPVIVLSVGLAGLALLSTGVAGELGEPRSAASWWPAALDLLTGAVALAYVATRHRQRAAAVASLLAATLGVPLALIAAGVVVGLGVLDQARPDVPMTLMLLAAGALALGGVSGRLWRPVLRGYAIACGLVVSSVWLALLVATWVVGSVADHPISAIVVTTTGLVIAWTSSLLQRPARTRGQIASAVAATGGYALLATLFMASHDRWVGLLFFWLVAAGLAVARQRAQAIVAVGLAFVGVAFAPPAWYAPLLALLAVIFWNLEVVWPAAGPAQLRTSALPAAVALAGVALAARPQASLGTLTPAYSDVPAAALTLLVLGSLAALVARERRSTPAAVASLVAGSGAVVALVVAQRLGHPLIVLGQGAISTVGLCLIALAGVSTIVGARATQPWRPSLLGYAIVVGLIAPWLVAPGALVAATSVGLVIVMGAAIVGLRAGSRRIWGTAATLALAFAALAAAIAPGGLVTTWAGVAWVQWMVVAWSATLAAGLLVVGVTQRAPRLLYLADGWVMVALVAATATGRFDPVALVGLLGMMGWVLALIGIVLAPISAALRRPLLDGGLALGFGAVGVGIVAGGWLAASSALAMALLLAASLLVLCAATLRQARYAIAASGLIVGWLLLRIGGAGMTDILWYSTPVGMWLAALAATAALRRQPVVANALAVASALVVLGVPLEQSLSRAPDGGSAALLGGSLALAYLAIGLRWRIKTPTAAGVVALSLIAAHQVFNRLQSFPSWVLIGLLGSLMLATAVALLLRREAITRTGADMLQTWHSWR